MLDDDFQKSSAVLRIIHGPGEKSFRKSLNRRQRGAEFVRNVRDEISAHALQLSQIRDVVQHEDCAIRSRRANRGHRRGKKMLPQRSRYDFRFHARLARENLAHCFDQFRLTNPFHQATPRLRRHAQTKNFRKTVIRKHHALCGIHHEHAFHHAAQNRRGKISLFCQRANRAIQPRRSLVQGVAQNIKGVSGGVRSLRAEISFCHALRKRRKPLDTV